MCEIFPKPPGDLAQNEAGVWVEQSAGRWSLLRWDRQHREIYWTFLSAFLHV